MEILSTNKSYTKTIDGKLFVLRRVYIGRDGIEHTVTYLCEGPAGSRFILDSQFVVTLDLYYQVVESGRLFKKGRTILRSPWDTVRTVSTDWVPFEENDDILSILSKYYGDE